MGKDTPSMAKNKIRRSLQAILDPYPTRKEIDELWAFFNSCCAYCGIQIQRSSRVGHLDHVVSSAQGGTNSVHNHVLACAICNGDQKREEDWQVFLARMSDCSEVKAVRGSRIQAWLAMAPSRTWNLNREEQAQKVIDRVMAQYDEAVQAIRALRDEMTPD